MTQNQMIQLISATVIGLTVVIPLTASERRKRRLGFVLVAGYCITYLVIFLLDRVDITVLAPLLLLEVLKFFIPGFLYYIYEKNIEGFTYFVAYITLTTLIRASVNLLIGLVTRSTENLIQLNYIGESMINAILSTGIAVVVVGTLLRKKFLEAIPYRIMAGILGGFFVVEIVVASASILQENKETEMMIVNIYMVIILALSVWTYLIMEQREEKRKCVALETVILQQYTYYHSLKEQEQALRKIRHDLANHILVMDGMAGEGQSTRISYQEQLRTLVKKTKETWNKEVPDKAYEHPLDRTWGVEDHKISAKRKGKEKWRIFLRNVIPVLVLFFGNLPLYACVKESANRVFWFFGYNILIIFFVGGLILWQKKREEKKKKELQGLLDSGNQQEQAWQELDEQILKMTELNEAHTSDDGQQMEQQHIQQSITNNAVCDAMLANKQRLCEKNQIELTLKLHLPQDKISPVDMICLLGNLLDNAIEACNRQSTGEREIHLKAVMRANFWIVTMENTKPPAERTANGRWLTTKEHPEEHGLGMQIIQDIVQKYDGVLKFEDNGAIFKTRIMVRTE